MILLTLTIKSNVQIVMPLSNFKNASLVKSNKNMQRSFYLAPVEVWLVLMKYIEVILFEKKNPNNILKYLVCSSYKTTGFIDQSFDEFQFKVFFLSLDLVTMYRMMRKKITF